MPLRWDEMKGQAARVPDSDLAQRVLTDEPCDVCGGSTYERRCKIICTRCGYTRDCSDP